jgi:5-methyltetrahydrofolate--homocysteine methyltransferase
MRIKRFELGLTMEVLVCDGAMGTMIMNSGVKTGLAPEELNLTDPDVIKDIHRRYAEAGADIIETNSFGGSREKLSKAGLADKTLDINRRAAELAREAVGDGIIVAGSIGPMGAFLKPLGDITFEAALDMFAEQAKALADGGADVIFAETFSDLSEIRAAIEAVKKATDLRVVATMSFDTNRHTIMGVSPEQAAASLKEFGADIIGANCGTGPAEMELIIREMNRVAPEVFLCAQPNAGLPELVDGEVRYSASEAEMAAYAVRYKDLGCKIVGSCCGSTPGHTRAIAFALKGRHA